MNAFSIMSEMFKMFIRIFKETYIPATNYTIWDASVSVFCFAIVVAFYKTIFSHAKFEDTFSDGFVNREIKRRNK